MEEFRTNSPAATEALGRSLADRFSPGDCIALAGPLGAGKTVLVRGIAGGLGLADAKIISSPSFVLVQEYAARMPVFHVDLYRLSNPRVELASLGIEEMFASGGVVLIEWADRAANALPRPRWQIEIDITGRRSRRLTLNRIV
jgi:tRNA threonylcarbamoyladenosine biosynthesis protein TsaE